MCPSQLVHPCSNRTRVKTPTHARDAHSPLALWWRALSPFSVPFSRCLVHTYHTTQTQGDRLGTAAYGVVYGGKNAFTGPTLAGCTVSSPKTLTIQFNETLLRDDAIMLQKYVTARVQSMVVNNNTRLYAHECSDTFRPHITDTLEQTWQR